MKYQIATEIFKIPYKNKIIIYAPLKQIAFLVNSKTVELLERIKKYGDYIDLSFEEKQIIKILSEFGIINNKKYLVKTLPTSNSNNFMPNYVTLFLTNKCNLRCKYCYACGGEADNAIIDINIAKEAINFVISNAVNNNQKLFGIGFHGGGEPTIAWEALKNCVSHAKKQSKIRGLKLNLSIATNGILSQKKVSYIIHNFNSLSLSIDGFREVHNFQRPLVNGKGSFDKVISTIKALEKANFLFGIRATVTQQSISYLDKFVVYMSRFTAIKRIQFEPVSFCGRCILTGVKPPSSNDFINKFKKARKVGNQFGISVFYSAARTDTVTMSFCKACGDSFCVTPKGDVSSCYEVCSKNDSRSSLFFYGKWNVSEKRFIFDKNKLSYLQKLTVDNCSHCADCFCKYNCAGDCLAKTISQDGKIRQFNDERCKINRALTLDQIIEIIDVKRT
jgi:uncharacterized protein